MFISRLTFQDKYDIIKYIYLIIEDLKLEIYVVSRGRYIGTLSELSTTPSFKFSYADEIDPDCYLLGLQQRVNESNKLFPVFDDLIPENKDKLEAMKANYGIRNTIELLLHLDNIHGSFEFYREFDSIHNNRCIDSIQYNDVKNEILGDYSYPEILDGYVLDRLPENIYSNPNNTTLGLSGYQEKHSVSKDDIKKTIKYVGSIETEYFIKPFNIEFSHYGKVGKKFTEYKRRYYPYLLINEHIFMSLAKDFGFDVPYNGLIKDLDHNEYHLIVKRFDRYRTIYKFDHHTINSFLGKISDDKYKVKLVDVINEIKEKVSLTEMQTLFRFIVFSVIISHGDLHAKNISLIFCSNDLGDKRMQLSPMYDILTTKIYNNRQNKVDIGMKLNNKGCNINRSDFLLLAENMGISAEYAQTVINDFCTKFLSSFMIHFNKLPEYIKSLNIKVSNYSNDITLLGKYIKYFQDREQYIREFLMQSHERKNIFA